MSTLKTTLAEQSQKARAQQKEELAKKRKREDDYSARIIAETIASVNVGEESFVKSIVENARKRAATGSSYMEVFITDEKISDSGHKDVSTFFIQYKVRSLMANSDYEKIADVLTKETTFDCILREDCRGKPQRTIHVVWDSEHYQSDSLSREHIMAQHRARAKLVVPRRVELGMSGMSGEKMLSDARISKDCTSL